MPSSSLVEVQVGVKVGVEVEFEIGVEVEVKVRAQNYFCWLRSWSHVVEILFL